jgi:hypothetical protein
MLHNIAVAFARISFVLPLLMTVTSGYAEKAPFLHRGPWPIHRWHQLQPRADQLNAMHVHDLTRQEARKVDKLYWELEGQAPNGADYCDAVAVSARDYRQCRAAHSAGARVLPSRPVPTIMAPER